MPEQTSTLTPDAPKPAPVTTKVEEVKPLPPAPPVTPVPRSHPKETFGEKLLHKLGHIRDHAIAIGTVCLLAIGCFWVEEKIEHNKLSKAMREQFMLAEIQQLYGVQKDFADALPKNLGYLSSIKKRSLWVNAMRRLGSQSDPHLSELTYTDGKYFREVNDARDAELQAWREKCPHYTTACSSAVARLQPLAEGADANKEAADTIVLIEGIDANLDLLNDIDLDNLDEHLARLQGGPIARAISRLPVTVRAEIEKVIVSCKKSVHEANHDTAASTRPAPKRPEESLMYRAALELEYVITNLVSEELYKAAQGKFNTAIHKELAARRAH